MRPVLPAAVRRLWRDRETLQLGRAPGRAVVLDGVDPPTRAALALLDGSRDDAQVLAAAAAAGCPPDRTAALLRLLHAAGLLEDGGARPGVLRHLDPAERERLRPDLASLALVHGAGGLPAAARRRAARLRVLGAGRVGAVLAALLAAAGVGSVDVDDPGTTRPQDTGVGGLGLGDVGRTRGTAARERVRAIAPAVDVRPHPADLVVLAPADGGPADDLPALLHPGTPHLLVEVRDTVGVVGPLVLPGTSPCLRCLDLTRADLDPGWPAVAAQLAGPPPGTSACDGVLAVAVAATASQQALALVDGDPQPASVGGTLELALPDWRWRRRTWRPHPDCGCVPRAAG